MMRMASALLVLTLLTTSVVSGTFAKYTTSADATSTARVAKWGVEVTASGSAFATSYATDDDTVKSTITNSVVSAVQTGQTAADNVVAPGTSGSLVNFTLKGTPEVAVNVSYEATLTISDTWKIETKSGDTTNSEVYFPIVITVGNFNYKMGSVASSPADKATSGDYVYTTLKDLKDAVEGAINGYSANYAANTDLSSSSITAPSVSWSWAFSDNGYQTDAKDTALGNLTTAPTIELTVTTTVSQID
jgi:hypothetical protein